MHGYRAGTVNKNDAAFAGLRDSGCINYWRVRHAVLQITEAHCTSRIARSRTRTGPMSSRATSRPCGSPRTGHGRTLCSMVGSLRPLQPNGAGVILLHGVGAERSQMAGHAAYLLHAGFTVLLPDLRGHGSSAGAFISYGVLESADVHAWADWLLRERPVTRLYGAGRIARRRDPRWSPWLANHAFAPSSPSVPSIVLRTSPITDWNTRRASAIGRPGRSSKLAFSTRARGMVFDLLGISRGGDSNH